MAGGTSRTDEDLGPGATPDALGPEWFTPAEAALFAGTTRDAVIEAIEEHRLPAWSSRDGARTLIPSTALASGLADSMNELDWDPPSPPSSPGLDVEDPSGDDTPPVTPAAPLPVVPPIPEGARAHSPARTEGVPEATDPIEQGPETDAEPDELRAPSLVDQPRYRRRGRRRGRHIAELIVIVIATGLFARAMLMPTGAHPSVSPGSAHRPAGLPSPTSITRPTPGPTAIAPTTTPPGPHPLLVTRPVFTQHGDAVTASARLNNPNQELAVRSIAVTFVVRDRHHHVLARHRARVSLPASGSVRAVATNLRIHPAGARVAGVVLRSGHPHWESAASFRKPTHHGPALRVEGTGLSSTGPGNLTVVVSVSNAARSPSVGKLVCTVHNAASKAIGSVTAQISLPPQGGSLFRIPMASPRPGAVRADCEIIPEGR
jgi:hypothetical protein